MNARLTVFGFAGALALAPALLAAGPQRFDGHKLVEVDLQSEADLAAMLAISQDHWSCSVGLGAVPFRVPPERMASLEESGLAYRTLLEDIQPLLDREQGRLRQRGGGWFDDFKTYAEINAYLDTLVALRPDLATKIYVGASLQGRDIFALRIANPDGPADRPAVLYNGGQHAREWIGPLVPMHIADRLVRDADTDAEIGWFLRRVTFYLIPLVNPDGYEYSWTDNRMWRKNRRGGFGVDTNRNWGYEWGHSSGSSGSPGSQTYRGSTPFSEPETRVVRDFILAHADIRAHIDFHSYSQLILSPWTWIDEPPAPPDDLLFRGLNRAMATAIVDTHGLHYDRGPGGLTLYLASGTMPDWTYGARGIPGWTIELRPNGPPGFVLPAEEIVPTVEEAFEAVKVLTHYAARLLAVEVSGLDTPYVAPDETATLGVTVADAFAAFQSGTARLYARGAGESAFVETPLADVGGGAFEAALPAVACGETIEYYIAADTTDGRVETWPARAPEVIASATAAPVLFFDNAQEDRGWIAGAPDDDATRGGWGAGNPRGGNQRGVATQPEDDHTPGGGLLCYFTDERDGVFPGNGDVVGGKTTLTSPALALSSASDPVISYWRWHTNVGGAAPSEDVFQVDVSSDGGQSWVNVETVGPAGAVPGWKRHTFHVGALVPLSSQVQVRFVASDYGDESIIEAAVDDFLVVDLGCGAAPCAGDLDGNGGVDLADLSILLGHFGLSGGAAPADGDLDGDGDVDLTDLSALLGAFGGNC